MRMRRPGYVDTRDVLSQHMRALRVYLKLSMADMAVKLGWTVGLYRSIEEGKQRASPGQRADLQKMIDTFKARS